MPTAESEAAPDRWLNRGVAGVGAASFFSDSGHEMVTSVLPHLVGSLGGGPAALGLIDGVADALVGVSKLAGGTLAADPDRRRRIASGGYVGTALATAAIGLCVAVWQVAILRAAAWISRGLRSPARDMLLTTITPREAYGRATGLERAGDNAGAVLGPVMAAVLVGWVGVRWTIGLAFIPGVLAALAIGLAVSEARRQLRTAAPTKPGLRIQFRALHHAGLTRVLLPVVPFELGNLATTLLILRATGVFTASGHSTTRAASLAIACYAGHNLVAALASVVAGQWVDRFGPRRVVVAAACAYVAGYLSLAFVHASALLLVTAFVLCGMGIGLGETAQAAWVAITLPHEQRANGFGVLGLVQSLGDLGATVVAGALWATFSATVAFGYAAAWMLLALVAVAAVGRARSR